MSNTLEDWQRRLHDHFSALAHLRKEHSLPVFALEHGLSSAERDEIAGLLKQSLRGGPRPSNHWLAWVVYAAEQGYDYDGDEFWTTFERRTPLWSTFVDRSSLRRWFQKFHQQYQGFKPTGPWANWFSIIAWPITHALLPRDLQSQLARTLFTWRYELARKLDDSPAAIGQYIAGISYDGSSRFRNFLQQEEIAGRIVLALLSGRGEAVEDFIHPSTLERIVTDLQQVASARAWLRDARKAVERVQIKGLSHGFAGGRASNGLLTSANSGRLAQPYIRPSLTLRRVAADQWTPVVELPTLRPVADLVPELAGFLRQTRCSVAGSQGSLPAGWLMLGDQRRVLSSWPPVDQPMVRFENSHPTLDHLLKAEGCISAGPPWLFRVGSDGLAREVVGRMVRPGQQYVLVSTNPLAAPSFAKAATLTASGATALGFHLPQSLTEIQIGELRGLGLSVSETVHVSPAGLDARRWDGEGFAEWMEGETPCLVLRSDHPVDSYAVQLDGGLFINVPAAPDQPVFLKLTDLGVGQHLLTVEARGLRGANASSASGLLAITIRPPQPWIPGSTGHSGLVVTAEPQEPSLDQFWSGEIDVEVLGPLQQRVRACVELLDAAGAVLATEQVADLTLPITREHWRRALTTFTAKDQDPWAYLSAASGNLLIDGDVLGSRRVQLHRDVAPVRWVWHRSSQGTALRLIDDHEGDDPLSIEFYAFAEPVKAVTLSKDQVASGFRPDREGGLCVAAYDGQREALIVSMPRVSGGLSGLVVTPTLKGLPRDQSAIPHIVELTGLWSSAKLVGPLAEARRSPVIDMLRHELVVRICGGDWAAAEMNYARSQKGFGNMKQLAALTGAAPAFNFVLARDAALYKALPLNERISFIADLAGRYRVAPADVCAAALELSDWLARGGEWNDERSEQVALARRVPSIMRAARFLAIVKPVPVMESASRASRYRR